MLPVNFLNYTMASFQFAWMRFNWRGTSSLISWRWTRCISTMNNCEICLASGRYWSTCKLCLSPSDQQRMYSSAKHLLPRKPSSISWRSEVQLWYKWQSRLKKKCSCNCRDGSAHSGGMLGVWFVHWKRREHGAPNTKKQWQRASLILHGNNFSRFQSNVWGLWSKTKDLVFLHLELICLLWDL